MDSLQNQPGAQNTGNPQSIGQSSLIPVSNNLQGSIDNQNQLIKLPVGSLKVTTCQLDCATSGLQPAPKSNSRNGILMTALLIVVLFILAWRVATVLRRASRQVTIEPKAIEPIPETTEVTTPEVTKKTKKQERRRKQRN